MRDILPPKRMCSESRDLFELLEINYNISLTLQWKTNTNVVCGLSNGTIANALE